MPNGTFIVTVTNENGSDSAHTCKQGDKISSVLKSKEGYDVLFNGKILVAGRDPEMRHGDTAELVAKSGKARS